MNLKNTKYLGRLRY